MRVSQLQKTKRDIRMRRGFTLVELLVVISIIGVLVGLTVPAIFAVRRTFNNSSVKFEVQGLAQAVEAYRSKYGDYPPDGSSWVRMEAHLRKAFPNILMSELQLLNPDNAANSGIRNDYAGRVMDPAEALVFFLGGFSSDPAKPFTGKGGPFVGAPGNYEYNMQRDNSFYEFNASRLSVLPSGSALGGGRSIDEEMYGGVGDLLPVYASYGTTTPYVYFNHLTYQVPINGGIFFNFHQATPNSHPQAVQYGAARPLIAANPAGKQIYANDKTFQIISPGIDGFYGGMPQPASGTPVLFSVTGQGYQFNGSTLNTTSDNRFRLPTHGPKDIPAWDNVANCIEVATFRDAFAAAGN